MSLLSSLASRLDPVAQFWDADPDTIEHPVRFLFTWVRADQLAKEKKSPVDFYTQVLKPTVDGLTEGVQSLHGHGTACQLKALNRMKRLLELTVRYETLLQAERGAFGPITDTKALLEKIIEEEGRKAWSALKKAGVIRVKKVYFGQDDEAFNRFFCVTKDRVLFEASLDHYFNLQPNYLGRTVAVLGIAILVGAAAAWVVLRGISEQKRGEK